MDQGKRQVREDIISDASDSHTFLFLPTLVCAFVGLQPYLEYAHTDIIYARIYVMQDVGYAALDRPTPSSSTAPLAS